MLVSGISFMSSKGVKDLSIAHQLSLSMQCFTLEELLPLAEMLRRTGR